jgi:lincosamide and streptogramin A transport system ATP-binding/permease protein
MLALLFLHDKAFPLIDEPTNHLDREGRALGGAIPFGEKRLCAGISRQGALSTLRRSYSGIYQDTRRGARRAITARGSASGKTRELFEAKTNTRLEKDIARLKAAAKRTESWSIAVEKNPLQLGEFRIKG